MTPYEKRRLELDQINAQARVRSLEQGVANWDARIAHLKACARTFDQALDLGIAQRRRAETVSELANARVQANNIARQLAGPPAPYTQEFIEREERALAFMSATERLASGR